MKEKVELIKSAIEEAYAAVLSVAEDVKLLSRAADAQEFLREIDTSREPRRMISLRFGCDFFERDGDGRWTQTIHGHDTGPDRRVKVSSEVSPFLECILRLRAESESLRKESAARLHRFCVPHWDDKNNGNCPLCERNLKDAEIARLKAALEVERAACDRWRAHWNRCGYSATMAHDARVLDAIIAHDESRAASRAAQDGAR